MAIASEHDYEGRYIDYKRKCYIDPMVNFQLIPFNFKTQIVNI